MESLSIQKRLFTFVTRTNWILLCVAAILGSFFASQGFTLGIIAGGLIVTVNFHLLYRTLKRSLKPPYPASPGSVLFKYYIRFLISGLILFILISKGYVEAGGLFVGLSVVVASIFLATLYEVKKIIFEEAV